MKEYFFSKFTMIISVVVILSTVFFLIFISYTFYLLNIKSITALILFVLLFFAFNIIDFCKRFNFFIRNIPAIILTQEELIDNINFQVIEWKKINKIEISTIKTLNRVSFIAISLKEPEKYIVRVKNPLKKFILFLNGKYFKGTISIQPNIIKCNKIELMNDLILFHSKV